MEHPLHVALSDQALKPLNTRTPSLLLLLIIFFLPTQLGLHFWPDFSIVSGLRIDYLSPTIYFTDILIIVFSAVCFIDLLLLNQKRLRFTKKIDRKFIAITSVFLTTLIIGVIFSSRPLAGIFGLLKLLEFILFGLLAVRVLSSEVVYKHAILAFALGMLIQSFLAIGQFYAQASIGSVFYFLGERTFGSNTPGIANTSLNGALVLRPYGTLPHPNVLAGYLLIGLLLISSELKTLFHLNFSKKQNIKYKLAVLIFTFVISSIALILTMSRSAILIGFVIVLLAIIKIIKDKKYVTFYKFLIPLLIMICLIIFPIFVYRFADLNIGDESISQRVVLAHAAIEMFIVSPIFGVGLSNFLIQLPERISLTDAPLQPVHNIYLMIAAETGLAGLLYAVYFIYKSLFINRLVKSIYLHRAKTIFIVILILGVSDHYFLTLQQGKLLLTLSICIIYARNKLLSA